MARTVRRRIFGSAGAGLGLALFALVGMASCSGSQGSLVSPCKSELTCGQACDPTNACGTGQYCGDDAKCTAECVAGDKRCGDGKTCSGTGHCVAATGPDILIGSGGTSSSGGGSTGTGGSCASTNVDLSHQLPTVLLLVDQSGSMDAKFGTSDRWQTLRTALMDPTGIVKSLQAQVRFGLTLFSGRNGAPPCPELTSVAPMLNNFPPIDTAYPVPTSAIIEDTPTGESIDGAVKLLAAVTDPGPKVIVLATDGEPDTCADPDPGDDAGRTAAKERAIKAAQDAFAQGIFTFYISVGDEVSDMHATEMANVGQGFPRNDPMQRFYRANDQKALTDAFAIIVAGVRNCSFQLSGTVASGDEALGTVTLDGAPVPYNSPDGWRLSSPSTVELTGKSCDTVKDKNDHKITAEFPCGSIVPFKPPT
jgi:von Willebrand factor type A domain